MIDQTHPVESDASSRTCPICRREARVAIEPGQFGMDRVTFLGHYVSNDYHARPCGSVGVPHIQPRIPETR